jgi:glucose/arabinose dehydrogenase
VFLLGGTGAAYCRYWADCHLRHVNQLNQLAQQSKGVPAHLPTGFAETAVATGLTFPTDFAFLPDGRVLVTEKEGLVRVVDHGRVLATPFIDLRSRVNTEFYRGLVAVQVDPSFDTNGYVYLLYVERSPGHATAPTTMRLIRVTAHGNTASLSTAKTLLGSVGGKSCSRLPRGSDCLPSDKDHNGGAIEFARDGTMFVSTGDGGGYDEKIESAALGAQDLGFLGGKLLRVTRDGKGVPSNPFWNGDPNANRSKVWAYGFRNPFRFSLRPPSEVPYVGDVGAHAYEEIDVIKRGGNYGWPCYEGPIRTVVYHATAVCKSLYPRGAQAVDSPAYTYPHLGSESVTGGVFYDGATFPSMYRGAYMFGDWVRGWIKVLNFDATGRRLGAPRSFATDTSGPVAIRNGPNGALYYLAINAEELRRVVYTH